MPTESGYSNQKKKGIAQYKTIQSVGSDQYGSPSVSKRLYDITLSALPIASISEVFGANGQVEFWNVEVTAHGAKVGNIFRMITGNNKGYEFEVVSVIGANNLYIFPISPSIPQVADTVKILGWVTPKANSEGEALSSSGPIQIIKNSVLTTITKDTGTPANTVPIPVEIVAASGTEINITAGDINVQTTHLGANHDSMRIGDGTNLLGITASNEAKVIAASLPLPTGAATSAKQDANTAAINLLAKLTDTQPVSAASLPLPTGAATSALQTANTNAVNLLAKLTDTQPVSAASLPLPSGAATSALQTANSNAVNLLAKLTDTQPVSAASLPLPTGAATAGKQPGTLITQPHDEIVTTYVGATTKINTVVYKLATATVATLTLGYDGSDRLISVVRS